MIFLSPPPSSNAQQPTPIALQTSPGTRQRTQIKPGAEEQKQNKHFSGHALWARKYCESCSPTTLRLCPNRREPSSPSPSYSGHLSPHARAPSKYLQALRFDEERARPNRSVCLLNALESLQNENQDRRQRKQTRCPTKTDIDSKIQPESTPK